MDIISKEIEVVSGIRCGGCGERLKDDEIPTQDAQDAGKILGCTIQHFLPICYKCYKEKSNWEKYGYYQYFGKEK